MKQHATETLMIPIPNACIPVDGICSGGRPRPEHLQQAKQRGIRYVVNLCPKSEACDYDEEVAVIGLGMDYINIPVSGPADLTIENATRLAHALEPAQNGHSILLHCASGNRVGALLALKAHFVDGVSAEEALAFGRSAGLTALLPVVTQLLGL